MLLCADSARCAQGQERGGPPLASGSSREHCQPHRHLRERVHGPAEPPGGHGMVRCSLFIAQLPVVISTVAHMPLCMWTTSSGCMHSVGQSVCGEMDPDIGRWCE